MLSNMFISKALILQNKSCSESRVSLYLPYCWLHTHLFETVSSNFNGCVYCQSEKNGQHLIFNVFMKNMSKNKRPGFFFS